MSRYEAFKVQAVPIVHKCLSYHRLAFYFLNLYYSLLPHVLIWCIYTQMRTNIFCVYLLTYRQLSNNLFNIFRHIERVKCGIKLRCIVIHIVYKYGQLFRYGLKNTVIVSYHIQVDMFLVR